MHRTPRLLLQLALPVAMLAAAATAAAQEREVVGDTLLIERVQSEPANLPARGMTMQQVQARFGVPAQRLEPRGGQKRQWPTIHRWSYPGYTVYFERTRVIDVVLDKAAPTEVGPKPPIG
ncbi:hypothetical protein MASR1M8_13050 [Thermomonas brevis]